MSARPDVVSPYLLRPLRELATAEAQLAEAKARAQAAKARAEAWARGTVFPVGRPDPSPSESPSLCPADAPAGAQHSPAGAGPGKRHGSGTP